MGEEHWLDGLARALARGTSRKDFLKLAGAALLGLVAAPRPAEAKKAKGCPTGQARCASGKKAPCVDLQTDPNNCGSCGAACPAGQSCRAGACGARICQTGQITCPNGCCDATSPICCPNGCCDNEFPVCCERVCCRAGARCGPNDTCLPGGCPSGQTSCGGACADLQTDAANCGACGKACASGQRCAAGVCGGTSCADDRITVASLQAARAALRGGATDVALSPGGCTRIRRTFAGGQLASEELTVDGHTVSTWTHTATESIGQEDADGDGFFETRISITRGPAADDQRVVTATSSAASRQVIRRDTYTRAGDKIHVVQEVPDATGTLVKDAEFDTTLNLDARVDHLMGPAATISPLVAAAACTADQLQQILGRLDDAITEGLDCLEKNGLQDIRTRLLRYAFLRDVSIDCAPLPNLIAQIGIWSTFMSTSDISISVDPARFGPLTDEQQKNALWHELLHLHFGAHNPAVNSAPRVTEIDETYACASLCFTFNPAQVTKCSCARCLKTTVCDPRCQAPRFKDCVPDLGAFCPCPCRLQWYPTQIDCAVACPSGLCCFAFRCKGYSVKCP